MRNEQDDRRGLDDDDADERRQKTGDARRRFLKAAGVTALALPAMETLSRQGLLVRSARAQTVGPGMGGGIGGNGNIGP